MSFLDKIFKKSGQEKKAKKNPPVGKVIGKITHYYGEIGVAVAKFNKDIRVNSDVHFYGATTDYKDSITSFQHNHKPVKLAKKNQQVGIKVKNRVREGDRIFLS